MEFMPNVFGITHRTGSPYLTESTKLSALCPSTMNVETRLPVNLSDGFFATILLENSRLSYK